MKHTLHIGDVEVGLPAVQAALSGYSDLAMRTVAREHGATYAINEVVLDALVLQKGKLQRRILSVPEHDHPVGGQLMGSQPETFGKAARALVRAGYDIVDIIRAALCASGPFLQHRGGWLLQDVDIALSMVESVMQAVQGDAPVSVKMRRGTDDSPEAEKRFWTILEGAMKLGIAAATVHPRTVRQKYIGPSRWEFLA
ncbi:MAG TPA: tRNA-dihydrouridine synthase family protein, partial [Planctomycetes bacterium]|nr:tRNA-dihydrouridine synthase family protein [Planctomycetota bacterium]